jgi:flagellar assembly protein FliH
LDTEAETVAERKLGRLFPKVEYLNMPNGSKLISILEVDRFAEVLEAESEAARRSGYEDGRKAGNEAGLAEARRVMQQFDQSIADAVRSREAMLEEAKQKILELVIRISRKVTCDAVDIDREKTAAIIAGIINQLTDRSQLKILVHPEFLPIVEQNVSRYLTGSAMIKELIVEADARVRLGGCFIQTPTGDIDARLESQFEIIESAILADEAGT